MARRIFTQDLGLTVQKTMTLAGISPDTLSKATDLPVADLNARLQGVTPFTVGELAKVGGFLSSRPSVLTEGMHA